MSSRSPGGWLGAGTLVFAGAALALGCGKQDIDLSGKACPCPDGSGYSCDAVCKICVPEGTAPGSSCSGSGGAGGGGGSGGTGGASCAGTITFQNFRAAWATPEVIRWEWEPLSPVTAQDQFKTYEIEVTADGEAPKIFDGTTNPELGVFVQPNGGVDYTQATHTSGLTPGTLYTGLLRAIDTNDCVFASAPTSAPKTIQPKGGAFELYADTSPGNGAYPFDATEVTAGCRAGGCLRSTDCQGSGCWNNMGWSDTAYSAPISAGDFSNAYVEFYVKSNAATPLWWCDTFFALAPSDFWHLSPYSVPSDDQFHKIQLPLRWFSNGDVQLDYAAFASTPISQFVFIGAGPTDGSYMWIDDAYLRW